MNGKKDPVRVVKAFHNLSEAEQQMSGGKGKTLAYLHQHNYPVPHGFVILPTAFTGDELSEIAWTQVKVCLEELRQTAGKSSFAVRSSALCEDSPYASFAGEFETVLDRRTDNEILAAIRTVRQSRHSDRVRSYCQVRSVPPVDDMAVVVQQMVHAYISGVLFTADPIDGSRTKMVGNFVSGLGEKLVAGEAQANSFTLERPNGRYSGPPEIKRFAHRLYVLANRLEHDLGSPQDIEWAVKENKVYILQSRPITTLMGWDPVTGESNDSCTGDYVWSSVNFGEAMSVVMTPLTSSLMRMIFDDFNVVPGHAISGSIGGRFYQNSTVMVTLMRALRQDVKDLSVEMGGVPKDYLKKMDPYLVPLPQVSTLLLLRNSVKMMLKQWRSLRQLKSSVASNPAWCRTARQQVLALQNAQELLAFFHQEFWPQCLNFSWIIVASGTKYGAMVAPLRRELATMVGAANADILLSNVSGEGELLQSLEPVVGLAKVSKGKMRPEEYLEKWGHRGPMEVELSEPRPAEVSGWLDRRLEECRRSGVDVESMLASRRAEFNAAWERFRTSYPNFEKRMRRKIEMAARAACAREAARAEGMRVFWVARDWAIRAGEVTGLKNDVFYLTIQELIDHMSDRREAPTACIPMRRQTYERYKSLPPYPIGIRGRFEPFQWANDPNRNSYFFDSHGDLSRLFADLGSAEAIIGMPGSAGRVEGVVCILNSLDDGGELHSGEVLVTSQTNIGWTLLFPKAAAIVTDVGAPLSHAAIVARELGIPAVVNCGDATRRLHTGDKVRVDGTKGEVEILRTKS